MNNQQSNFPWGWVIIGIVAIVFISAGGLSIVNRLIGPQSNASPPPTTSPTYEAPPPDPTQNSSEGDFFDFVKTNVPPEQRETVHLTDILSTDLVRQNQYLDQNTYIEGTTAIEIVTAIRARATQVFTALVWPPNMLTRISMVQSQPAIVKGTELRTNTIADAMLVIGTTKAHALNGITNVVVEGNTVNVTAHIPMTALSIGIPISPEDNRPQVEHERIITPDPNLNRWLMFSSRLTPESDLNNLGTRIATKEALWLILHQDGNDLWQKFKASIEEEGSDNVHDILTSYIKDAFCRKLTTYQQNLVDQGKKLEFQECGKNVTINVTLIADKPTDPNSQDLQGVEFMTMARTGFFVQTPDPLYHVEP